MSVIESLANTIMEHLPTHIDRLTREFNFASKLSMCIKTKDNAPDQVFFCSCYGQSIVKSSDFYKLCRVTTTPIGSKTLERPYIVPNLKGCLQRVANGLLGDVTVDFKNDAIELKIIFLSQDSRIAPPTKRTRLRKEQS
jgi:hypothetical protein